MKKTLIAAAMAAVSLSAMARTFELAAWKGETVSAVVPDFVEFGELPEGVDIKFGLLRPVKYAPDANSIQ